MSASLVQPLQPYPGNLRLFRNTVFEESEEVMARRASSISSLDKRSELNEPRSRSSTPSLCIDDGPVNQHAAASVPPLELGSRDSSLFASNDPFNDHPDIDLRSDSEGEVISISSQTKDSPKPTRSQQWDELNARLQRFEPRFSKTDAKQMGGTNPSNITMKDSEPADRFIYINKQLSGQTPTGPSLPSGQLPKINCVKSNKMIGQGNGKSPGYTYQLLHQLKSPADKNGKSMLRLSDQSPEVARVRSKPRRKTHMELDSFLLPRVTSDPKIAGIEFTAADSPKKPGKKRAKESKQTRNQERRKSQPCFCLHPRGPDFPIFRRNTMLNNVNPDHPEREYYVHSISGLGVDDKNNTDICEVNSKSFECTASGIYRLCMKQQADLVKAHNHFRQKHMYSSPTALSVDQNRQYPSSGLPVRSNSSTSTYFKRPPEHLVPDPFKTRRCNRRSESFQSGLSKQQRYTLRDYAVLPNIPIQIQGLGPDLQSDQYKEKLAKRQRQKNYADRLREHSVPHRSSSHRVARLPKMVEEPMISSPKQPLKSTLIQHDGKIPVSLQSHECEMNEIAKAMEKQNINDHNLSVESAQLKVNGHLGRMLNGSETELSPEELERKKAAEKRETMLSYAKRIQTKMTDKRKRSQCERPIDEQILSPNENKTDEMERLNSINAKLAQLLERHEQDQKFATSIQKVLRFNPNSAL